MAGAVVAGVGVAAYESSVIGANNSSSSSTVASLQDQLTSTQQQLNNTADSLTSANATISSLNSQLSATQGALSGAQSSLTAANSQNSSLSTQLGATQSSLSAANGQVSTLQGQLSTANSSVTSLQSSVGSLQSEVSSYSDIADGLTTLNLQEAAVVAAMAEAIIPTDSNGAGANEAGAIYFIDRQLNGDYGNNGRMYMGAPFVQPGLAGPITVNSASGPITYSAGTPTIPWVAGQYYEYPMSLRNFWRYGILALETYANSAYGGNFETLTQANQQACLADLFNNKPTSFNSIKPSDFANEVFFMSWAGFLMDPMYGGNRGMVGWVLTASPGLNNGNFYGEGQTPKQRMVASTPTILKPASLAQFQKAAQVAGLL